MRSSKFPTKLEQRKAVPWTTHVFCPNSASLPLATAVSLSVSRTVYFCSSMLTTKIHGAPGSQVKHRCAWDVERYGDGDTCYQKSNMHQNTMIHYVTWDQIWRSFGTLMVCHPMPSPCCDIYFLAKYTTAFEHALSTKEVIKALIFAWVMVSPKTRNSSLLSFCQIQRNIASLWVVSLHLEIVALNLARHWICITR